SSSFFLCRVYCFYIISLLIYFFFFFFSSRRRHTRFSRDWSSDVCSSDLGGEPRPATAVQSSFYGKTWIPGTRAHGLSHGPQPPRSEERRVGKECRSRWWTDH